MCYGVFELTWGVEQLGYGIGLGREVDSRKDLRIGVKSNVWTETRTLRLGWKENGHD